MKDHNVQSLYKQVSNWDIKKLQRYLIAREDESLYMLPLALALMHKTLPEYGSATTALDDPVSISDLILELSRQCDEDESLQVIEILCSIAEHYLQTDMDRDFLHIRLMVKTAARIAVTTNFSNSTNKLICLKSIEKIHGKKLTMEKLGKLALSS